MSNLHPKLPFRQLANSQSGFAVIPLLILILFGIAAGTLLVQNGSNFLPKAVENGAFPCTLSQLNTPGNSKCASEGQLIVFSHCDIQGKSKPEESLLNCREASTQPISVNMYCTWNKECTGTGLPPGVSTTKCSTEQETLCAKEPWQPKGGCVITTKGERQCKYGTDRENDVCNKDPEHPETGARCGNAECRVIDGLPRCITSASTCPTGEQTYCRPLTCEIGHRTIGGVDKKYTYCKAGTTQAPAAPPAAPRQPPQAPAGAPAAATAPRTGSGSTQKVGSFDNKVSAVECPNPAHKLHCETYFKEHGLNDKKDARCYMINGHARCMYEKNHPQCSSTAQANDVGACSQQGGCVLEKVTIGSTTQYQFSRCSNDSSGFSSNASSATTGTTGCESLKDADGLTIPCYKIGVFTPEELIATEAQAKVALQRYDQYRQILKDINDAIGNEIDAAIKAKAEEKIARAEELAKACLAR